MSGFSPERWRALSPHLDRALEMTEHDRGVWLHSLRAEDPTLAAELTALLEERNLLERERFLAEGAPSRLTLPSLAGQTFGAYTLVSQIGHGGTGSVWLARRSDGRFEGQVAVKLLNVSLIGRAGAERFHREGNILARLSHPYIAHLIDAGFSPLGQPYLVLEHVDGEPIDAYCDGGKLSVDARIHLFLDVLDAVAHAHANLIVHRDIKPSNVLATRDGRIKLLDFGIAKLLEIDAPGAEATALTREGGAVLTPEYAAPEQVTAGPITTATDVYALGVLLYLLLSGRHPAGDTRRPPSELLKAVIEAEPPRLSDAAAPSRRAEPETQLSSAKRGTTPDKLRRMLQGDLDTIVAKALKKDPRERYPSVTALADDLRRYLEHEPISARPDTLSYRTAKFVRRHRGGFAAAAFAALALMAATIVMMWQMLEARRQRDEARYQAQRAEASSEILSLMLEELGPGGKPLTMDALLARGVALLERRYASDPHLTGLMMVQIARRYQDLDRPETVRAILERAIAEAQPRDDAEVMASAQCALAAEALSNGQPEEAARALDEGQRAMSRLTEDNVQPRVDCLRAEARLQDSKGLVEPAVQTLETAKALLERTGNTRVLLYTSVLNDLGFVLFGAGRLRESLAINETLIEAFERNGRGETLGAANMLHNRAALLLDLGEVSASEAQARSARERVRAFPDVEASSFTYTHARSLIRLGRAREAVELLRAAVERNEAHGSSARASRFRLELAVALVGAGEIATAERELEVVEAAWTLDPGANAGRLLLAGVLRAEIALLRNQPDRARQHLDQARPLADQPTASDPGYRAKLDRVAAMVALARGDASGASSAAEEALSIAEGMARVPSASADVGEALLLRAQALLMQGHASMARPLLERAIVSLGNGLGPEHALTQRAKELLATTPG
jgi:serine/threonine-protein kinase